MKYLMTPALISTALLLSACGGGSDSSDTSVTPTPDPLPPAPITFNLGISDAPVDGAEAVVITIESITFKGDDIEDMVFETFDNAEEGIVDAETIQIDLLQFQGSTQFNVLENEEIDANNYNQVVVNVLDQNVELSYVTEIGGENKPIKVPSDNLKLGGIDLSGAEGSPALTIEFNLNKSMTYKPGPDEYNLKPTGVRIVDNQQTGSVSGNVDISVFNENINCAIDEHKIYIFEGHELDTDLLADNFDEEENNHGAPENAIAPFDNTMPSFDNDAGTMLYEFGFVPVGNYTLVYACNLGEDGDDPDSYDGITLPNPVDQIVEITVTEETVTEQSFPIN